MNKRSLCPRPRRSLAKPKATGAKRRKKAARKPTSRAAPIEPPPADAPYWLPAGADWRNLPAGLRRAVTDLVQPAFRRLVLEAPGELERSAGITLVHLMWLEICDQRRLVVLAADRSSIVAVIAVRLPTASSGTPPRPRPASP